LMYVALEPKGILPTPSSSSSASASSPRVATASSALMTLASSAAKSPALDSSGLEPKLSPLYAIASENCRIIAKKREVSAKKKKTEPNRIDEIRKLLGRLESDLAGKTSHYAHVSVETKEAAKAYVTGHLRKIILADSKKELDDAKTDQQKKKAEAKRLEKLFRWGVLTRDEHLSYNLRGLHDGQWKQQNYVRQRQEADARQSELSKRTGMSLMSDLATSLDQLGEQKVPAKPPPISKSRKRKPPPSSDEDDDEDDNA